MFLIVKQNRYLRRLRMAGATRRSSAITLEQLGLGDTRLFRRLVRRGVIAASPADRFYLDPPNTELFLRHRRRSALVAMALAAGGVGIVWLAARWWS
jgi:hypothetical protein